MSTRAKAGFIPASRLSFKVSFFQDAFTIIEELTGDCPEVGLPEGFCVLEEDYKLFKELQKKYHLTKLFITDFNKVKNLAEWNKIEYIIKSYKIFWQKQKYKLSKAKKILENEVNTNYFLERLQKVTKCGWNTNKLVVFLTIGYKDSGTCDREIKVIRLGIHENKEYYLVYTLYHELIHYHIINHMKILLKDEDEEILCRAIFNLVFKDDLIAQKHWREHLSAEEIRKIDEKSKQL